MSEAMKIPAPAAMQAGQGLVQAGAGVGRRHPDIFTAEEAVAYLHLDPATDIRALETLRIEHGLVGFRLGKGYMYHRKNLDELVARLAGMRGEVGGGVSEVEARITRKGRV